MAEHNSTGKWGEDVATEFLTSKGYAIVDRNWRVGHLELDVVAVRDGEIVFVEVKTRTDDRVDPLDAIDSRKIRHIANSANAYLQCHDYPHNPRFDVIAVSGVPGGGFTIEHIIDAFDAPVKTY